MKKWMDVVKESNDSFDSDHSAENLVNYYDEENPDFGDPIDLEFSDKLAIGGTINTVDEDHCVIDIDSTAMAMLEDLSVIDTSEGYEVLPKMDKDKYQERDGLEGPIMTRSGKVLYYDPKAGNYYDPDTDMYITYNQWKEYDSSKKVESIQDQDEYETEYEYIGDDGEQAMGYLFYKVVNGKVDPKSLRGESEYDGNAKVDDEFATYMVKQGGPDHENAIEIAQEDYDEKTGPKQESKEDEDTREKLKALDDIKKNPHTAKDPELQKQLMKRTAELKAKLGEAEEKPYVCVHAKKGKHECHATSSYGAAKKAAEHWGMKSTAGIDAHLAVDEAEYQGKKVTLNKPIRTGKDEPKKFKVYVKDGDKVKMVRFGHQGKGNEKTMKIKKSDPARRKSFRARHNCSNPGPKTKARYWSCRAW